MVRFQRSAVTLQREYYAATAGHYDEDHVATGDPHFVALGYISSLLTATGATSVLDIGSGTGRAVSFLRERHPAILVVGVEPVWELVTRSERADGGAFVMGSGLSLPFADNSIDVVCSTALLHHVPKPALAIQEMMRVARRGIMISDANRFGQGRRLARVVKLGLWRAGLWPAVMTIRTRGRGFQYSDLDGIFYSYSIFDSAPMLDRWADRTFVIPTNTTNLGGYSPLLNVRDGLLVAMRDRPAPLPAPREQTG